METATNNNNHQISSEGNNKGAKGGKRHGGGGGVGVGVGKAAVGLISGSLVYYHCAYRRSSLLSLASDVLIVLLCSLAILGLLFRQLNISVPVDPLEWQISQEAANGVVAWFANTVGAAESVLRVAATGHDKRLFFKATRESGNKRVTDVSYGSSYLPVVSPIRSSKVVFSLYMLSALGRLVSGVTVAYAALCLFCLYMIVESSESSGSCISRLLVRQSNGTPAEPDSM